MQGGDGQPTTVADLAAALRQPIAEYLDYLRYERRYSAHTCDASARDLMAFADYCGQAHCTELGRIDTHTIRGYVASRHRAGLSPSSLQRHLSTLRGFFKYQLRLGRVQANPAQTVRAPKAQRHLPPVISADALSAALEHRPQDAMELRDQTMVELFYSGGLRLSELWALNAADVDAGQTEIILVGKGRKERTVMIGRPARAMLDLWLRERAVLAAPNEAALFVSSRGRRLSRGMIGVRLRDWAVRAGLGVHLHPHRLRHSFATHMLESSGDLRAVQEMLGHAHLSTTQIYTHLDWKRLAAVYDDAHPRARRKS